MTVGGLLAGSAAVIAVLDREPPAAPPGVERRAQEEVRALLAQGERARFIFTRVSARAWGHAACGVVSVPDPQGIGMIERRFVVGSVGALVDGLSTPELF
ncbi:MAG: hypothetical protein ACK40H_07630, partial [Sphingomonadaceae bacterium]